MRLLYLFLCVEEMLVWWMILMILSGEGCWGSCVVSF